MFGSHDPHLASGYSLAKMCIRKKVKIVNFTRIGCIRKMTAPWSSISLEASRFFTGVVDGSNWDFMGGAPLDRVSNQDVTPAMTICTNHGTDFMHTTFVHTTAFPHEVCTVITQLIAHSETALTVSPLEDTSKIPRFVSLADPRSTLIPNLLHFSGARMEEGVHVRDLSSLSFEVPAEPPLPLNISWVASDYIGLKKHIATMKEQQESDDQKYRSSLYSGPPTPTYVLWFPVKGELFFSYNTNPLMRGPLLQQAAAQARICPDPVQDTG